MNAHPFPAAPSFRLFILAAAVPILFAALGSVPVAASPWGDERRIVTLDLSARHVRDEGAGRSGMQYDAGIDAYAKFGSGGRDVATGVMQLFVSRLQRHPAPAPVYDGASDTELMPMINTINLHLLGDRSLNLKVGHFEIPYGLEATVSNAGELRGFTNMMNNGLGLDWGATLNGTLPGFQYEVGLGRGSGLRYADDFNPWSLSARVGSPVDVESYFGVTGWGVSVFRGRTLDPRRTGVLLRQRVALDGQYYVGPFGVLGEISLGRDGAGAAGTRVLNGLAEVNVTSRRETLSGFVQLVGERRGGPGGPAWTGVAGVRWAPAPGWAVSLTRDQRLWREAREPEQGFLNLQVRRRL